MTSHWFYCQTALCHSTLMTSCFTDLFIQELIITCYKWILTTSGMAWWYLLKFNGRKCKCMFISRRKQPFSGYTSQHYMERVPPIQVPWSLSYLHPQFVYMQVTAVCKKKQGYKWVFYTESSSPLEILHHFCNCTWLTSVHIWSMQYGILTNRDLSTPLRECRNLHLRTQNLELWLWVFAAIIKSAHPCQQKTLPETVSILPSCQ